MEFFAFATSNWDETQLKKAISMDRLDSFADSIEKVLQTDKDWGNYFTIWGEFKIIRIDIKGGYRFVMPHCPNGLTWSVTTGYEPYPDKINIHTTINRKEQDPDFVETLVDFTNEWADSLEGMHG
ncbi:MAG: hypothetical protein HQL69_03900 [Magnetococcales bacterium]|nr:hypothetical protein [Magnetococcales bacterium]